MNFSNSPSSVFTVKSSSNPTSFRNLSEKIMYFFSLPDSTSCYSTEQLHRIDRAFGGDHACLRHRDDEFSHVCGSRRIDVTDCLSLWEEYRLPSAISELLEDPRFQKNELKLVAGDGDDSGGIEDSQWDDRVSREILK